MPGWTSEFEWRGYLHESEWPSAYNPARGYLVSANNKVAPDSFPFMLGSSWEAPYRAARIVEMIERTSKLAVEDMSRMQRDVQSAQVKVVLPFLLKARPLDTPGRDAMDFLREWDGTLDGESPQAALYEAWYDATVRGLFEDDLGEDLAADYTGAAQPGGEGRRQPHPVRRHDVVRRRADAGRGNVRDAPRADAAAGAGRHERPAGHVEPLEVAVGSGERRAFPAQAARRGARAQALLQPDRPARRRRVHRDAGDAARRRHLRVVVPADHRPRRRRFVALRDPDGPVRARLERRLREPARPWNRVEYLPMRFSRLAVDDAAKATLVLEPRK